MHAHLASKEFSDRCHLHWQTKQINIHCKFTCIKSVNPCIISICCGILCNSFYLFSVMVYTHALSSKIRLVVLALHVYIFLFWNLRLSVIYFHYFVVDTESHRTKKKVPNSKPVHKDNQHKNSPKQQNTKSDKDKHKHHKHKSKHKHTNP